MVNQPQQFRQHHITRALKAAAAAGMRDPTVTVQLLPTGATITIGSGKVLPEKEPGIPSTVGRTGAGRLPKKATSRPAALEKRR